MNGNIPVLQEPNKYAGIVGFLQNLFGGIQQRQQQAQQQEQIANFINKLRAGGAITPQDIPTDSKDVLRFGAQYQPTSPYGKQPWWMSPEKRESEEAQIAAGTKPRAAQPQAIHTQHYIERTLGELETSSPYSSLGVPMDTLITRKEHEDFATVRFGPGWRKEVPEAVAIIDRKFPPPHPLLKNLPEPMNEIEFRNAYEHISDPKIAELYFQRWKDKF